MSGRTGRVRSPDTKSVTARPTWDARAGCVPAGTRRVRPARTTWIHAPRGTRGLDAFPRERGVSGQPGQPGFTSDVGRVGCMRSGGNAACPASPDSLDSRPTREAGCGPPNRGVRLRHSLALLARSRSGGEVRGCVRRQSKASSRSSVRRGALVSASQPQASASSRPLLTSLALPCASSKWRRLLPAVRRWPSPRLRTTLVAAMDLIGEVRVVALDDGDEVAQVVDELDGDGVGDQHVPRSPVEVVTRIPPGGRSLLAAGPLAQSARARPRT